MSDRQAFEAAKRASTAQLLFKVARLVNEMAIERVQGKHPGMATPRAAHTALLPHIPLDGGIRLSALATKVGISKQAVGQLVDDMEAAALVERVADAVDGRAKLIRYTAKGKKALMAGIATLREVEAELEREIGAPRFAALHDALLALHDVLDR